MIAPATTRSKKELGLLLMVLGIAFAARMAFLHEPFERDEGWFASIAQEIMRGGIPYRDAMDLKPPGVFYIYALAIATFGKTTEAIRIFTAFYSLFSVTFVYWLARHLAGAVAGISAAAIFAIYSCAPLAQGSSSQSEVLLVLPLLLSVSFLVVGMERHRRVYLLWSGCFAGLAMLIKTVALPYVLLFFVFSFFCQNDGGKRERALDAVAYLAPMIFLALATMGYFFLKGALQDFILWNVTLPLSYSKGDGIIGPPFLVVSKYLLHEFLLPLVVAVPTAFHLIFSRGDRRSILLGLLLPASLIGVWLPGKFSPHYFIQLYPFVAVLAGVGLAELVKRGGVRLYLTVAIMAASFLLYAVKDYKLFFVMKPEEVSTFKHLGTFVDSVYVARYVKERTSPSDYIFQWGFEPELYFLSDRRPAAPYFSSTIIGALPDKDRAIQHLILSLVTKKPKYVIVQPELSSFAGVEALENFLRTGYSLETTLRYAYIFKVKQQ